MKYFRTPRFLSWIFPRRTWGFSRKENHVYLTFDDGPNPILTPWILDVLKDYGIKATFFCVGENVLKYPKLFERLKAEGHAIGNHTMQHEKGTVVPWEKYQKSVYSAKSLLKTTLFRPPYGRLNTLKSAVLAKDNKIIMWSWLSYDFDFGVPISRILTKAKKQIKAGDIILVHDNDRFEERVKEILPSLLTIIQEKNLESAIISA